MSRFSYKSLFIIFFFLLIGVVVLLRFFLIKPNPATAAWWNGSWNYRQAINISSHNTNESNVYIITTVNIGTTIKSQTDNGDFRFITQNGDILPYYISSGTGTTNITFHIQFSSFPSGAQTIYTYYGNFSVDDGFSASDFATEASNYTVGSLSAEEAGGGPIAYWKFDEGIGTTAFDSINNQIADLSGTIKPTWINTNNNCVSGSCLNFGGTNSYVQLPTVNNIKSISMWLYMPSGQSQTRYLFDARTGLVSGWLYSGSAGNNWVKLYVDGVSQTVSLNSIPTNKWVFLYLESNTVFSDNINLMSRFSNSEFLAGKLDEIKLYNYSLTETQIEAEYQNGLAYQAPVKLGIQSSTAPDLKSKLIAYWKFDEGAGTVTKNSIGVSYNLTSSGQITPTWQNSGKNNKSIYFYGIGATNRSYFSTTPINVGTSGVLTFSFWINPDTTQTVNSNGLFVRNGIGADQNYSMSLGTPSGGRYKITLNRYNGSWESLTTTNYLLTASQWNHVAIILNESVNWKIYVNGQYKETLAISGTSANSTSSFNIGGHGGTSNQYFNGSIDEFKIYNSALNADEIKQDYNAGSAVQMGSTNQTIGGTTTSLEYCISGDTSPCSAPIAEWNFEENIGTTARDTSGNNNHGVFGTGNSAPTWTIGANNKGSGINFDGTNDTINASNIKPTNFTASMWIYSTTWSQQVTATALLTERTGSSDGLMIFVLNGGSLNFDWGDGNSAYRWNTGYVPPLNTWVHLTFSRDNNGRYLYVNGKLQNSTNTAGGPITTNGTLNIGWASLNGPYYFQGKMDQVRIYNYARTPAQIAYDYNKGAPIAHWKLDECQGGTVFNSSGLGNTGVISIGQSGTQNSLGACQVGTSAAWTNGASGHINSSLNFDGVDDYVNMGDPANGSLDFSTNDFTTVAWFKTTSTATSIILGKYNTYPLFYTQINNGILQSRIGFDASTNFTNTTGTSLNDGNWHQIIVVYKRNGNMTKYIDGKVYGTSTDISSSSSTSVSTVNNFTIGASGGSTQFFSGQIDDVRIYNYALTSEQVKTLYNGGAVNFN